MELRHLRYFVAVAEEEHITRAAQRLGIQQPPLSQQIQQLESELGVKLLDRKPRSVRLNAAGKVFLSEARRVLVIADRAVQRVRDFDLGKEGSLRVGMTSSASMHHCTLQIIRSFKAKYPLVNLKIEEGANQDLLNSVEQENLDIAVVRAGVDRYQTLSEHQIDDEPMMVAIPAEFDVPGDGPLRLEDFISFPFVRYRQANSAGVWSSFETLCRRHGKEIRVIDEAPRIMSAIHLASAGFGITVVPRSVSTLDFPNLKFRELAEEHRVAVPLILAWRTNADAQAIRNFLAIMHSEMEKRGDDGTCVAPAMA